MKILVTGGAGYIGSAVVPLLLEHNYGVRVLDNLMYGGQGLLMNFRDPEFEFVKGDIRDGRVVRDAVKGCDAIIHLAAIVGFPACRKEPQLARQVNVEGTEHVAAAAGKSVPVLFASTGSNYGALSDDVCTEETPLNPLSLYGQTKTEAERRLLDDCRTVAYRFATAFGLSPRLRLDLLINDFVYNAVAVRHLVVYEKHYMRTFIHVRDIARSYLLALDHLDTMLGQVYNVGSDALNCSKEDICRLIQKHVDFYLHFADVDKDADQRNYVVNYDKIAALGFRTSIGLEEGITELIRALRAVEVKNPYYNV